MSKKTQRVKPPKGGIRLTGPKLAAYQVIVRPLVTEKGIEASEANNQYTFEVNPQANKTVIRDAVEELFDVRVIRVCTQNRKGKPRRYKATMGRTKAWKKAIVTLDEEHRIDFF